MEKNILIFIKNKEDRIEAETELSRLKIMKHYLKDNNIACEINAVGLSFGLCNNKQILPVIKYQIKQIKKFLKGKSNYWE